MDKIIHSLPENLNAIVIQNEELDEQRSYVGRKKIPTGYGLFFTVLQGRYEPCMLVKEIKSQQSIF
jgi:hypothetical protein